jgi:tight adherence protein B
LKPFFLITAFFSAAISVYFYRAIVSAIKNKAAAYLNFVETTIKNSAAIIKKSAIIRIEAAAAVLSLTLCAATGAWFILAPTAIVMLVIPKMYVSFERGVYLKRYCAGLEGFLEQLISSLKSGNSITRGLQDFCAADNSPVGHEISMVMQKTGLGFSIKDALVEMKNRVPVSENEMLVSALSTAIETGGNLSVILSTILQTIRQRNSLEREVKALTSQGILSGIIVGALPFMLSGIMLLMDPELMLPLFTTGQGLLMVSAAVVLEALGGFFIFKITDIKG